MDFGSRKWVAVNSHSFQNYGLHWGALFPCDGLRFHSRKSFLAPNHASNHGAFTIQVCCWTICDKKLGAYALRSIAHTYNSPPTVTESGVYFLRNRYTPNALAAFPSASGVTSLYHKICY